MPAQGQVADAFCRCRPQASPIFCMKTIFGGSLQLLPSQGHSLVCAERQSGNSLSGRIVPEPPKNIAVRVDATFLGPVPDWRFHTARQRNVGTVWSLTRHRDQGRTDVARTLQRSLSLKLKHSAKHHRGSGDEPHRRRQFHRLQRGHASG
jgi:hypothetical protein